MRWPRWERGRQDTGYRKLKLLEGRSFDVHVIDYPRGTDIPWHCDPIPGKRHLRINLSLPGGAMLLADPIIKVGEYLNVFWSDRIHAVTEVRTRRVVLSIGVAL
jgi:hypothetical protein